MVESRRTFLKESGLALAGTAAASLASAAADKGASETIVLAAIGCGGQGTGVIRSLASNPGTAVAYVCDPDLARANKVAKILEGMTGKAPTVVQDLRKVLDDKSVDAVTVTTPDHWHGPATILALDAQKHVYVEKPCSHNIREGRLMIDAAKRNKRHVQVGTQSRSAEHVQKAIAKLREGAIGDVLVAKAWNSQKRANIGHATVSEPPGGFDYDLWVGPAPMVPFQPNRHHYTWHWWYDFGTGDMGNDGVHELDIARWGLGVNTHPSAVGGLGGKYFFDDDQQFPDTQYMVFEYPGDGKVGHKKQLVYEQRIWSPYVQDGHENGNAFYGSKGMMILGKGGGWTLYGPKNQVIESMKATSMGPPHQQNFLAAIRGSAPLNCTIEEGHYSAALCHLGNIAARLGRTLRFDPTSEKITSDDEANRLVSRDYRDHWATPKGV